MLRTPNGLLSVARASAPGPLYGAGIAVLELRSGILAKYEGFQTEELGDLEGLNPENNMPAALASRDYAV
jgi:hypothetical protein